MKANYDGLLEKAKQNGIELTGKRTFGAHGRGNPPSGTNVAANRIRQGDIFWLDDCPPLHGDVAKRRPVVVISPSDVIETQPSVLAVACTTSLLSSDKTAIELPSRERTHQTKTGLTRRTWVGPRWLVPVERHLLMDYIGRITGPTLRRVLGEVAAIQRGDRS